MRQLSGPFADIKGITSQTAAAQRRQGLGKALGAAGWCAIGWPKRYGGRDADLAQQVIFAEEYARARAPGRLGHMGVELAGPTILHFGSEAQKERFLPKMSAAKKCGVRDIQNLVLALIYLMSAPRRASKMGRGQAMGDRGAEDLDVARSVRRLVFLSFVERYQAPRGVRFVLSAGANGSAGCRN